MSAFDWGWIRGWAGDGRGSGADAVPRSGRLAAEMPSLRGRIEPPSPRHPRRGAPATTVLEPNPGLLPVVPSPYGDDDMRKRRRAINHQGSVA